MKKFLCFLLATVVLAGLMFIMVSRYVIPSDYPVFFESFDHGRMTIASDKTIGEDNKFEIFCKYGEKVTVNINPERSGSKYYNLDKLIVNGVDKTDDVKMLEYTFKVSGKTTVLAYFKKAKASDGSSTSTTSSKLVAPDILDYAENEYLGSANAYNFESPSIIYDSNEKCYYCFGSNNVVMRSTDLHNWENRTNYFNIPSGAETKSIMEFSQFPSVEKWAKDHGYTGDEYISNSNNNREPKAPEIIKIGGTYFLYFSITKEANTNESAIFCVKTDNLAEAVKTHTWEDVGLVVASCKDDSVSANASMPSVFLDKNGTKLYMAYGEFFGKDKITGAINLLQLDTRTGLLATDSAINSNGDEIGSVHGEKFTCGTLLANPGRIPSRTKDEGSLISACDIVYNDEEEYYYLFMTYGTNQTNYEVRVARSKDVDGPYLDKNGNDVAAFGKTASKNQYKKGTLLLSGYNFSMSSGGGVSYTDVGRGSIGAPSVLLSGTKWIIASQSRAYYKVDGKVYCGDKEAEANDYEAQTKPALEIRQIRWEDGWPMALPEVYNKENVGEEFEKGELNGHWDVIIFDGKAPAENYDSVSRYTSKKISLFGNVAITESMMDEAKKLDSSSFKKINGSEYSIILDGVKYTVYPATVWDNELDCETTALTGFGENGTVIWAKKGYNAYMGIYLDCYNYLIGIADEELAQSYTEKLNKISDNPSQDKIDSYTKTLIKKILESYEKK